MPRLLLQRAFLIAASDAEALICGGSHSEDDCQSVRCGQLNATGVDMFSSLDVRRARPNSIVRVLVVSFALVLAPTPSVAGLVGQTVALDQLYPVIDKIALSLGIATVGTGIEFSSSIADYDWDVADASIGFSRLFPCGRPQCYLGYTPSSFNGFRLGFSGAATPQIVGVEILEVEGFSSFNIDRVTFDTSNVYVRFGGIEETFNSGTIFGVKIGLQFVGSVPEPAAYSLVLCGLGAVGWLSGRRRSRSLGSSLATCLAAFAVRLRAQ